jgi:predicted nuclease with TOPRIM domain
MDVNARQDRQDLRDRLAHLENQAQKDHKEIQDLRARQAHLESQALKENRGLQDLLARLESVVVSARQFWYHKTTLLKWMIIILALLVMDRLLLHFPQIAAIVTKLL